MIPAEGYEGWGCLAGNPKTTVAFDNERSLSLSQYVSTDEFWHVVLERERERVRNTHTHTHDW